MRHYIVDPDNEERLLKIPLRVVAEIKAEALAAARRIVAGFLNIDETGDRQCADPTCDLCVVAPLIYAALEDLSAGVKT